MCGHLEIMESQEPGRGDFDQFQLFNMDENKAMLGVTTEQHDKGAEIQSVSKESAAEKAGLKKGDIITKIADTKVETPDDLSKAVKNYKPGEKVTITYLRDKKEQKVTAELTKWKGLDAVNVQGYRQLFDGMDRSFNMPGTPSAPRQRITTVPGMNWSWSGGGPKLGISVQDTEDGKGVNVIDVDDEGNAAKAGIKENDVITEVDGKAVNSADEIAKVMKESKEK